MADGGVPLLARGDEKVVDDVPRPTLCVACRRCAKRSCTWDSVLRGLVLVGVLGAALLTGYFTLNSRLSSMAQDVALLHEELNTANEEAAALKRSLRATNETLVVFARHIKQEFASFEAHTHNISLQVDGIAVQVDQVKGKLGNLSTAELRRSIQILRQNMSAAAQLSKRVQAAVVSADANVSMLSQLVNQSVFLVKAAEHHAVDVSNSLRTAIEKNVTAVTNRIEQAVARQLNSTVTRVDGLELAVAFQFFNWSRRAPVLEEVVYLFPQGADWHCHGLLPHGGNSLLVSGSTPDTTFRFSVGRDGQMSNQVQINSLSCNEMAFFRGQLFCLKSPSVPSIQVCNASTGVVVREFGAGHLNAPDGFAISRFGRVFVADNGAPRIQVFNASGHFESTLNDHVQARAIAHVVLDSEESKLFVGAHSTVATISTASGHQETLFDCSASAPNCNFNSIVFDGVKQWVYGLDYVNGLVVVWSVSAGRRMSLFGSQGTSPGQFVQPHAVAVLGPFVFVGDNTGRIQRFSYPNCSRVEPHAQCKDGQLRLGT